MVKILYLNEVGAVDAIGDDDNIKHSIENHPLTEEFTLEEFVERFNHSEISDLGYVALTEEDE